MTPTCTLPVEAMCHHNGDEYFHSLPDWEKDIMDDYDSKALERTMLKANESFGHGRGACMGLSLDEIAVIDVLDVYYSQ